MSQLPEDLYFTAEHEWVRVENAPIARVGVTAYATSELGDIVYVSLPTVGSSVESGDSCGELESTKSVSDIFCPLSGVIVAVNDAAADQPDLVGQDPFGEGWLFEVEMSDPHQVDTLLEAADYAEQIGE